jgi:O-antigen ligase
MVDGLWAGFFTQRNALGMNAAIGLLVFAMLAVGGAKRRLLWISFAILSATLLLLSGSATSMLAVLLMACGYVWHALLVRHVRSTFFRVLLSGVIVLSFVAILASQWDGILSVFGKSPDMTGRTEIWGAALAIAQDKPLFGYGYGGFWVFGGPAQAIWDALGGDPATTSYAHNGYLQIFLDTGIVGLGMLLALVASAFRKAWGHAAVTKDVWPLCFFTFLALYNLGEATYAVRNSLCWLLFVAILAQLVRVFEAEGVETVELRGASCRRAGILANAYRH